MHTHPSPSVRRVIAALLLSAVATMGAACTLDAQSVPAVTADTPAAPAALIPPCAVLSWEYARDTFGTLDYVGNGPDAPGTVYATATGETVGFLWGEDSPNGIATTPECAR